MPVHYCAVQKRIGKIKGFSEFEDRALSLDRLAGCGGASRVLLEERLDQIPGGSLDRLYRGFLKE